MGKGGGFGGHELASLSRLTCISAFCCCYSLCCWRMDAPSVSVDLPLHGRTVVSLVNICICFRSEPGLVMRLQTSISSPYAASKGVLVACCQVHAYTACPNNQTAYLAELKSGKEVLVVDGEGRQRSAIIGRVKIEARPLVCSLAALWLLSAIPTCLCRVCTSKSKSCTCSVHQDLHAPGSTPCAISVTRAYFATWYPFADAAVQV